MVRYIYKSRYNLAAVHSVETTYHYSDDLDKIAMKSLVFPEYNWTKYLYQSIPVPYWVFRRILNGEKALIFELWDNYDIWYYDNLPCVNDRRKVGFLVLPENYTKQDILKTLKFVGCLKKNVRLNQLSISDDENISINDSKGVPMFDLIY